MFRVVGSTSKKIIKIKGGVIEGIFDIHFHLRDTADFVSLLWGILNNAGSPINTY